jgi:hydroxypyruvate isomerase
LTEERRASLTYDLNCSILYTELPLLERPVAARSAGFDAVELWWPFSRAVPSETEADRFVHAIEDAGVRLVALNFFGGDIAAGERGVLSAPARVHEFRASVEVAVELGRRLGCTRFNALYGNRIDGVDAAVQDETAIAELAAAARAVASIGGVVLIEPLSDIERYPLLTAADAIRVIERVRQAAGIDNLRLLADLFHLSRNGEDVDGVIAAHAASIGHVQIADAPGRHEPGTGSLPLERWVSDLERAGYHDYVGLEYSPSVPSELSFEWLPRERRGGRSHDDRRTRPCRPPRRRAG